jgi:hypothetical protein
VFFLFLLLLLLLLLLLGVGRGVDDSVVDGVGGGKDERHVGGFRLFWGRPIDVYTTTNAGAGAKLIKLTGQRLK